MKIFLTPIAAITLIAILLTIVTAGCLGSQAADTSSQPTSGVAVQNPAAGAPTATAVAPVVTVPSGAMKMGTPATFGLDGQSPATVNIQRYAIWDKYEWKNTYWGNHFFNTTPQAGNKFLVLYLRMMNTGSKPVLAPSPTQFVIYSNGKTYHYSSTGDPTLWINGTDRKQIDYAVIEERPDRNINPDPDDTIDGYIIYEVPQTFDPSQSYVDLNLMGVKTVDWQFT